MDGSGVVEPPEPLRRAASRAPESQIVEIFNYGRGRPGLIPLWVGEGDLATPDFICAEADRALKAGETFYTYQLGIPPLREGIARYLGRHFDVDVGPERVYVTASGMQAIQLTMQLLIEPGDEVVMVTPLWPNILAAVGLMDGVVRSVPLSLRDGRWHLDLDRLFDACGPHTKALFINSPANPTGWVMEPEDMQRVVDFARRSGLWLIADEVYARMVYDGRAPRSFLSLMEPDERLIVVNSFSKNWAMTGWRVGWMVAPASLAQTVENLIQYNTSGVATFVQHAAHTAIDKGDGFVAELVERCRVGRDIVCQRLGAEPRVRLARPAGAFYLFFGLDGENDSRSLAMRLVDETAVGLAPGSAFGPGGEGFLRLCFAISTERLSEAMDRLVPALR